MRCRETCGVGAALKNRDPLGATRRYVSSFKTELRKYLGTKTFLIGLAGHGQVEDDRCDTLPRPTAFVRGETKLSANGIKGSEHGSKVMKLEGTGTWTRFGHSRLADFGRERNSPSTTAIDNFAMQAGVLRFALLQS